VKALALALKDFVHNDAQVAMHSSHKKDSFVDGLHNQSVAVEVVAAALAPRAQVDQ
jgi:hypothetical protein